MVKGSDRRRELQQLIEMEATNFIRQWRKRPTPEHPKGLSQVMLAELSIMRDGSSLTDGSISNYETGETEPSIEALQAISKALGVPRGMLLDVDPRLAPELWDAWLRASPSERQSLNKVAAGLIGPLGAKKRRA